MCAQFRTGLAQSVRITQATPRRHREADARHRWVGGWRRRGFGTAASGSDTEPPRRPPLAVRLALRALLAGLVVLAFSTALRGRPGPIDVLLPAQNQCQR